MSRILTTLLLLFSSTVFGQLAQLKVEMYDPYDDSCYQWTVFNAADTVVKKETFVFVDSYTYTFKKKNLVPGTYTISVYNCNSPGTIIFSRTIKLFPNQQTRLSFDVASLSEDHYEIDTIGQRVPQKAPEDAEELQFNLSYLKSNWINTPSVIQSSYAFGFSMFSIPARGRHVGFLLGGGLGFSQHFFSKDTSFMSVSSLKKRSENYTYFNGHIEAKLRLSQQNQKLDEIITKKLVMDVGVLYNLPVLFKHYTYYEDNKKITNSRLHQYTDARAFVNIGWRYVAIYGEYRLFNFIIGKYPELPVYTIGLKLMLCPIETSGSPKNW